MDLVNLENQLGIAVKQLIKYKGLYEGQKSKTEHTELWLDGYRQLTREKGVDDLDRLLEILLEIESENSDEEHWERVK